MPSSSSSSSSFKSGNTTSGRSNPNLVGASTAPRIQISLGKDQRKSTAAASVTPAKTSGTSSGTNNNNNNNTNANAAQPTILSAIEAKPCLYKSVRKALKTQSLNFKINVECTSLKVSPSGNFLWGGFSDGTLRVWDLSGTFGVEDDDVIASRQKTDVLVNSKLTQGYGAVACQIHARGVHTDLITTVDISDDAQYVFVGVSRGATELHAVFVGDLERAVHTKQQNNNNANNSNNSIQRNILDYIKVYCHSDAKLKGFGACATMRVAGNNSTSNSTTSSSSSSYLLLTGKGIKNIHIWKFTPPKHPINKLHNDDEQLLDEGLRNRKHSICEHPDDEEDHGIWDQLYDTSTNGNTILLLGVYRDPQNKLLAVSKSDAQKLRLWDLSFEEEFGGAFASEAAKDAQRPKRPPYKDVANSQSALEIAGGIGVCGGGNMYNEMSIVSLDRPDDPFNHTELALPSSNGGDSASSQHPSSSTGYSSRRQRRGEMKAVVNVATSPRDSSHALLVLDDGSLVGYSAGSSSSSSKDTSGSIPKLAIATPESTGIPALPADFWRRCICLANIAGVVIAASSLYNPNTNKGQLVIRALGGLKKPRGSELRERKKLKLLKQQQKQKERMEREQRLEQEQLKQKQLEETRLERERMEKEQLKRKRQALLLKQQEREREKQVQQRLMAPPKTPSPIHTHLQLSPVAADSDALRDAVSAPKAVPVSDLRTIKNPLKSERGTVYDSNNTAAAQFSSRVSPNGTMETPRHHKNTASDQDDSPDSTQDLPKISKFMQPKRIDMQAQQLQEKPKKRKEFISEKDPMAIKMARKTPMVAKSRTALETPHAAKMQTKKVASAASKPSVSPVPTFQLNSVGSIPFKSPKPQTKKQRKVDAPSKPKKPTSVSSISFSTPKSSRDASGKFAQLKVENRVVFPANSSEKSITKAAAGERKRDREVDGTDFPAVTSKKIAHSNEELSTAILLTALASPKPASKAKTKLADGCVGVITQKTTAPTGKPNALVTVTPMVAAAVTNQPKEVVKSTSKPKSPPAAVKKSKGKSATPPNASIVSQQQASREEVLHEKISEQYEQLRIFLNSITESSMALVHSRNLRGPVPSALASGSAKSDSTHLSAYSKLLTEHRAAHDYLQRGLLRSAERTLRLLLESRITADEARTELKQSIKKFEEILYDTLHRQEMERLAVVAQHYGTSKNFARSRSLRNNGDVDRTIRESSTKEHSVYPCKEAFDKVEDICAAISRPVGRPRSALAALR